MVETTQQMQQTDADPSISLEQEGQQGKKKSLKTIRLNIVDSSNAKSVLERLCKNTHGWVQTLGTDFDLKWMHVGTEPQVLLQHLLNGTIINRYPDCWDFACKNVFGEVLNFGKLMHGEDCDEYDFVPDTYILPKDTDKLRQKLDAKECTYIGKPNEGSQGDSITLIREAKDIPEKQNFIV